MPDVLSALDAFLQEHRRCGEIEGGVDGGRVWMTCDCGADIAHPAQPTQRFCPERLGSEGNRLAWGRRCNHHMHSERRISYPVVEVQHLFEAYRRTSFLAETPAGRLRIRVGEASPALDLLLSARRLRTWAYVTAHNPRSVPLSNAENRSREARLEADVRGRGFEAFPGEGVGDNSQWPPERSLLVLGMSEVEAAALGREYGQLVVVWGELGRLAVLLACS